MSQAVLEHNQARDRSHEIYKKLEPLYEKPLPVAEARQLVIGLFDRTQPPYCDSDTAKAVSEALQRWTWTAIYSRRADKPMYDWHDLLRRVDALLRNDYPVQAAEIMVLANMVYSNIYAAGHYQMLQNDETMGFMRPTGVFYQILNYVVAREGTSQRWLHKALAPILPLYCDTYAAKLARMGLLEQVQWEPYVRYIPTRRGETMLQKTRPAWWKRKRV